MQSSLPSTLEHFYHSPQIRIPISSYSPFFSSPPSPRQLPVYLLSPWMCQFWVFHRVKLKFCVVRDCVSCHHCMPSAQQNAWYMVGAQEIFVVWVADWIIENIDTPQSQSLSFLYIYYILTCTYRCFYQPALTFFRCLFISLDQEFLEDKSLAWFIFVYLCWVQYLARHVFDKYLPNG